MKRLFSISLITGLMLLGMIGQEPAFAATDLLGDEDGFGIGVLPGDPFDPTLIGPADGDGTDECLEGTQSWTHSFNVNNIVSASLTVFHGGLGLFGPAELYINNTYIADLSISHGVPIIALVDTFDLTPFIGLLTGSDLYEVRPVHSVDDGWVLDYSELTVTCLEFEMCGEGYVEAVVLKSSDTSDAPNGDCYVSLRDLTVDVFNGSPLNPPVPIPLITTRAFGTQINLALLKEQNIDQPKKVRLCLGFVPTSTYWRIFSFECLGDWHDRPAEITCTDGDEDGYYVAEGCNGPVDCDDDDEFTYPGAPEMCDDDNKDNDCDGKIDECGSISGYVMDDNHAPINNAKVNLRNKNKGDLLIQALTDASGHYKFEGLVDGWYWVIGRKKGYNWARRTGRINLNVSSVFADEFINLNLTPKE